MTAKPNVLITAGGTGGHIYPALAVADWLRANGAAVSWLGARGGMEAQVVPRSGIVIDFVDIGGLRGKGMLGWLVAPFRIGRALMQALKVLRQRRPDAVLGMGGFVTGPVGLAARLRGTPLLIHEQNAVAGLTNRLLARLAVSVLEAFPGTFGSGVEAVTAGNPVRSAIVDLPPPLERFAGREQRLRVVVFGGSQGARALNETVPEAIARLSPGERPVVRHQSGQRNLDQARAAYRHAGVEADLVSFIDDMAAAYGWADLVICRAGALSVSELAAAGVPSVLVPFPHAVDDHQTRNARYLADAEAAILVPQHEFTAERLAEMLRRFAADGRARLMMMATAAHALAQPDAAAIVGRQCLAQIRTRGSFNEQ